MRRRYGASPLHLVGNLAAVALSAYAVAQILTLGAAGNAIVWLIAAVVAHDALLWPLYSGADAAGRRLLQGRINYVRVPAGLSLLLALVFVGTVSGNGANAYRNASGQTYDGYLTRWLAVSATLFAISGAVYLARRSRT